MRYKLLALALMVPLAAHAQSFDLSSLNEAVTQEFRRAWHLADRGNSNREVVVLVVREADGSYTADVKQDPDGFQTVAFDWNPRAVAIFHTHPNRTPAPPSPQDIQNSNRLGVPNFVLTDRGMWVYDPDVRKSWLVMPFLSWLSPGSWQ